ncbi:MAG: hypothetical protein F4Y02_17985 [Chloroflexi bacterium]|nr:hypothetical protein [Chloroflexota bacterium]
MSQTCVTSIELRWRRLRMAAFFDSKLQRIRRRHGSHGSTHGWPSNSELWRSWPQREHRHIRSPQASTAGRL